MSHCISVMDQLLWSSSLKRLPARLSFFRLWFSRNSILSSLTFFNDLWMSWVLTLNSVDVSYLFGKSVIKKLSKMAIFVTFQNRVIYQTVSVFFSRLLHRSTVMWLQSCFCMLLSLWSSDPKYKPLSTTLLCYSLCKMANFLKWCHFSNTKCVFEPFFA